MVDGVERRPKLPRNAPFGPSRKQTFIDPLGNIAIESAPFAPSTSRMLAKAGNLGATASCLLVAPDRGDVYEPPRAVWTRCMGAPNAEKRGPYRIGSLRM